MEDYFVLSMWSQSNHKAPSKREVGESRVREDEVMTGTEFGVLQPQAKWCRQPLETRKDKE